MDQPEFTPIPALAAQIDLATIRMVLDLLDIMVRHRIATGDDVENVLNHFEDSLLGDDGSGAPPAEVRELLRSTIVDRLAPVFATLRRQADGTP